MPGLIFVVDQHLGTCVQLKRALESRGYTVQAFASGTDALEELRESSPDLVIVEKFLAEEGGRELVGRMRAMRPELPAILMSAKGDLVGGVSVRIQGYLAKPLTSIVHVQEMVERIVEVSRRRAELRANLTGTSLQLH
jgi:DNA-binding NtrC family response regulator